MLRLVSLLHTSMDRHNTKVLHKKYSFYIYVHLTNITTFITFCIAYLQSQNWNKPCQWGIQFCNYSMLTIYSTCNVILFIKFSHFYSSNFRILPSETSITSILRVMIKNRIDVNWITLVTLTCTSPCSFLLHRCLACNSAVFFVFV